MKAKKGKEVEVEESEVGPARAFNTKDATGARNVSVALLPETILGVERAIPLAKYDLGLRSWTHDRPNQPPGKVHIYNWILGWIAGLTDDELKVILLKGKEAIDPRQARAKPKYFTPGETSIDTVKPPADGRIGRAAGSSEVKIERGVQGKDDPGIVHRPAKTPSRLK